MEFALAKLLQKARTEKLTQKELVYVQTVSSLCSRIFMTVNRANIYKPEKLKTPYKPLTKSSR